jgi:hypothetical protein
MSATDKEAAVHGNVGTGWGDSSSAISDTALVNLELSECLLSGSANQLLFLVSSS